MTKTRMILPVVLALALGACVAEQKKPAASPAPAAPASAAAAPAMPPQPREWLAPSVDMTPPPAGARWSERWMQGRSLPVATAGHRLVADGQTVYLIGGVAQREHLGQRDVWMTTVDRKTGALAPWRKTTALPQPTTFFDAAKAGGRVYVAGGSSREGMQMLYDNVWSAPLKKGGGLGPWRAERPLRAKVVYPAMAEAGGYLYVLGGFDGSEYRRVLYFAKLEKDGALGEWKDAKAFYPHAIGRTFMANVGGDLVVSGGFRSDSQGEHITSLISRGVRQPDGDVHEWVGEDGLKVASRSLRFSLAEQAGAADANFIYMAGGRDPDALGVGTAQASWINPKTGKITRWQTGPDLPLFGEKGAPQSARLYLSAAAVAGDHLIVAGGFLFVRECTSLVWVHALQPYRAPEWVSAGK